MRHLCLAVLLGGCAAESRVESADTGAIGSDPGAAPPLATEPCTWSYEEGVLGVELPPELQAVLVATAGARRGTLEWLGTSDHAVLDFELRDATGFRIGLPTSGSSCAPHVLVDLTLALSTSDGLLDEVLEVTIRGEGHRATLEHWVPAAALTGAWDPVDDADSSWQDIDVAISAEITAGDSSGEVTLYAVRTADGQQEVSEIPAAVWRPEHVVGR